MDGHASVEVPRIKGVAEVLRKTRLVQVVHPRSRAGAVVGERGHGFVAEVFVEIWIPIVGQLDQVMQSSIPAPSVIGVVAGEEIEVGINGDIVDVASASE